MKSEKELLESRAAIVAQVQDRWKGVKDEKRSPNQEELAFFDKADADITQLTAQIEEVRAAKSKASDLEKKIEDYAKLSHDAPESRSAIPQGKKPEFRAVLDKWMRHGNAALDAQERSLLADVEKRGTSTLISSTPGLGGYLMPEEWAKEIYRAMSYFGGALEASGIKYRSSGGGDLHVPTNDDTSNVGAIIGQGTGDTVADTTFSEVVMKAWSYTSKLIKVSWEQIEDSAYDMDEYVRSIAAERLGRILNTHFTTGDNSSKPQGLVNGSTLGKGASSQTVFTRAEIIDLIHSVNRAYRNGPKVGFMFNDTTLSAIKKLTFGTGDDRPLWQPSIREGEPDRLEGYKYWVNNDMANAATTTKPILFGNFDHYAIRQVGAYQLARSTERYIDERAVAFFVFGRFDGRYLNTAAVKHLVMA